MNVCSWEIAEIRNVANLCSTKEGEGKSGVPWGADEVGVHGESAPVQGPSGPGEHPRLRSAVWRAGVQSSQGAERPWLLALDLF